MAAGSWKPERSRRQTRGIFFSLKLPSGCVPARGAVGLRDNEHGVVGEPLRLGHGVTAAAGRDCEEEELLRRVKWIENKTHTGDAQQSELSLFTDYSGFVSSTHSKQAHWVSKVRYYILPSTASISHKISLNTQLRLISSCESQ